MGTLGKIEANLVKLNDSFRLPYLPDADTAFHESEYQRLRGELQSAHDASSLPELPDEKSRAALNALLIRLRLGEFTV